MAMRSFFVAGVLLMTSAFVLPANAATVIYAGNPVTVEKTLSDPTDLWVTPEDLTRVNGFVLKPEGACLDELCIPIRQDEDNDIVVTRDGQKWFNLTAFAKRLGQGYAYDADANVWSFAPIPEAQSGFLKSAVAPDFELKDRHGETVRLSDFRGKKVLIVTWASW